MQIEKRSPMKLFSAILQQLHARRMRILATAVAIAALYHIIAFSFYLHGTLEGQINNHILAGDMFGVPDALQQKGIKPLYYGPGRTGWDGQFYYYIANDLLGLKDTSEHIDASTYRYQRVGLSLYTAIVAALTGQDWVSPDTFFVSYFVLVLVATWFGAKLLIVRGGGGGTRYSPCYGRLASAPRLRCSTPCPTPRRTPF